MPRTYKKKNIQTSPELAGEQNMTDAHKGNNGGADVNSDLFRRAMRVKGTNWTEDEMRDELVNYFDWCKENDSKPSKAGLGLWLGCTKSTLWVWQNEPTKYGAISNLIKMASQMIEDSYVGKIEKYPTGNIFLLKSSHGHVETSKLDVTSNGKDVTNANNVADRIAQLGLDK